MTRPRRIASVFLVLACLLAWPRQAPAADLQKRLNAAWGGAWGILLPETGSACDAGYTRNRIEGSRAVAVAPHRLPAGELGRIAKVDVKRSRIDILVDIEEPLLVSWTEGPFELFDQVRCRVELELEVPREWIKKRSDGRIQELVGTVLELHFDQESVDVSESWNRRRVEALPEGYEETLAEYERWRRTRLRGELLSALDESLRSAQRVIDRADDDPAYGAGMAAGMEKEANRYRSWGDCERLARESFYPVGKDAPAGYDGSDEKEWEKGYRDGQILAFNVELARRMGACLEELQVR